MSDDKIIMFDSDDAATKQAVTGWVSRDGAFYGSNERAARWNGCTHVRCSECGKPVEKMWIACETCRRRQRTEKFAALDSRPWDGNEPVCIFDDDRFFWDLESFEEWCEDNGVKPEYVQLVFAKPVMGPTFDIDSFADYLPEDCDDLPCDINAKLDELNAAIHAAGPLMYEASTVRAVYVPEDGGDA